MVQLDQVENDAFYSWRSMSRLGAHCTGCFFAPLPAAHRNDVVTGVLPNDDARVSVVCQSNIIHEFHEMHACKSKVVWMANSTSALVNQ
jgi:hypothetical protein